MDFIVIDIQNHLYCVRRKFGIDPRHRTSKKAYLVDILKSRRRWAKLYETVDRCEHLPPREASTTLTMDVGGGPALTKSGCPRLLGKAVDC